MPQIYGQVKGRKYPSNQPIMQSPSNLKVCSQCKRMQNIKNFSYKSSRERFALCDSCRQKRRDRWLDQTISRMNSAESHGDAI